MTNALRALLTLSVAAFFWHLIFINDERHFLAALGNLSLMALLSFPVFTRVPVKTFDPFAFFTAYVAIGTTATSYLIAFGDSDRRAVIMDGRQIEFFMPAAIALSVAMLLVGLGFSLCRQRIDIKWILPDDTRISPFGFRAVSIITVIISIFAIWAFIDSTGGISLAEISKKRAIEIEQFGEIIYGNASYLRLAAGLGSTILLITLARFLQRPYKLRLSEKIILLILVFVSLVVPFISSSRLTVVYTLIGIMMAYSVYRTISPGFFISTVSVILVFFSVMTALRTSAQNAQAELQFNPFLALAESGNGLSLGGTAHILAGVPSRMDYQLGRTYLTWIYAPIPRSMWPDKPDVSLGKEIKEQILGDRVVKSGRPPSIFSEGYINFGWAGFFLTALSSGYVMRLVTRSFERYSKYSIFSIPIYFSVITNMTDGVNAAFSQIVVRLLADILPIYGIYFAMRLFSMRRKTRKYVGRLGDTGPKSLA